MRDLFESDDDIFIALKQKHMRLLCIIIAH